MTDEKNSDAQDDVELDRLVVVCAKCKQASCWHGIHMCDGSKNADTEELSVRELRQLDLEHPDNYSREAIDAIEGGRRG